MRAGAPTGGGCGARERGFPPGFMERGHGVTAPDRGWLWFDNESESFMGGFPTPADLVAPWGCDHVITAFPAGGENP